MEATERSSSGANGANLHDFLFELVSERCSSLSSSSRSKLSLQCTLNSWNRYTKTQDGQIAVFISAAGPKGCTCATECCWRCLHPYLLK